MTTQTETPPAEAEAEAPESERALLLTFVAGGSELVYLDDTSDADKSFEAILQRFEAALNKQSLSIRLGDRCFNLAAIRSVGDAETVELPETVANDAEQRTLRLLGSLEMASNGIGNLIQGQAQLQGFQAQLQQAQAQLFQAVQAEDEVFEDEAAAGPAPAQNQRKGALKPLKVPTPKS